MILIDDYIKNFSQHFNQHERQPWQLAADAASIIAEKILSPGNDYKVDNNIAIHYTAVIEQNVILKPPVIIGPDCFIAANAYLRGGVYLADGVHIGPGCEIKSSFIFSNTSIAHFNFIGDSLIGSRVNFEAGAVTANHYNERQNKNIFVLAGSEIIDTGSIKFGSLVGDDARIGANAVLSPGTVLPCNAVVQRMELVQQIKLQ